MNKFKENKTKVPERVSNIDYYINNVVGSIQGKDKNNPAELKNAVTYFFSNAMIYNNGMKTLLTPIINEYLLGKAVVYLNNNTAELTIRNGSICFLLEVGENNPTEVRITNPDILDNYSETFSFDSKGLPKSIRTVETKSFNQFDGSAAVDTTQVNHYETGAIEYETTFTFGHIFNKTVKDLAPMENIREYSDLLDSKIITPEYKEAVDKYLESYEKLQDLYYEVQDLKEKQAVVR